MSDKFWESPYPGNGYVIHESDDGWRWTWKEVGEADESSHAFKRESDAFESAALDWETNGSDFTGRFAGRLKAKATQLRKAGR